MNGIELSRAYFFDWGLPWIQEYYPMLVTRVAAGVFRGSQVFGADDGLSQDHGWGPEFLLLLCEDDFAAYGEELSADMLAAEPREWLGYRYRYPDHGITITSIDRYVTRWIGWPHPSAEDADWLMGNLDQREFELYLLRHGVLHYDPLGEFSARRLEFHQYPEAMHLRRVRHHAFDVWHYGQYNFLDRLRHRQDPIAMQMALGHFSEAVMRLCLLLEHDFAPYWKWLAFEFRKRVIGEVIASKLCALAGTLDIEARCALISDISDAMHVQLQSHGLAFEGQAFHPHSLFCDMSGGPLKEYK